MPVALHMARLRLVCVLASTATLSEAGLSSTMSSMFGSDATEAEAKAQTAYTSIKAESIVAAEAAKAYCAAYEADADGTPCCSGSTCYWDDSYPYQTMMLEIPDIACDSSRGPKGTVKCEGGGLFPYPKAGICVCNGTGLHCVDNTCQNKDGGMMGEMEVVRRLFSVTELPQEEPFLHQGIE
mmetsp:Transcript_123885/g.396645  ORF Transcript_123885/g.396645 Transcript_123885/m.396645 type:complete len:182 (-) Transcript_123885:51-596(-)|eukprot:CAMPEP_0203873140 /NCGR_PEP_ID=MMETSP0359-20131031/19601_1 /ASSEMBLY_ACC=CAM_ASM_000338 /TAXON_ID=268821 /ORGANISM="Scrippsiella Hangoei, Strain SHTV-5" /LENGTH=181 /DNA_ID=CAMNT_0050791835 /DNA_START=67 /DNA_END=612 /DNA_ORIENTATION=+